MSSAARFTAAVAAAIALVIGLIVVIVWQTNSFDSTDGGHIGVVRNGGPLDNTKIRQILPPSSGRTSIGFLSDTHLYPTSQRFFTISSNGKGDSDDVVVVPTADGVQVGIEGTAYFTLNVDPKDGYKILKDFDNRYGTRSFKCSDGNRKNVYDGDDGFSCFLEQVVSPVINNDLRVSVGELKCADLVSSCSLVQNTQAQQTGQVDPSVVGKGNSSLAKIESDISSSLQKDLDRTLGGHYLIVEQFNLAKVDLPKDTQAAIDKAQASYASVTNAQAAQKKQLIEAQTRLKQAQIDAQANAQRQKGYTNCPTCAQIDIVKALPKGITVYAPGNPNVALPTK